MCFYYCLLFIVFKLSDLILADYYLSCKEIKSYIVYFIVSLQDLCFVCIYLILCENRFLGADTYWIVALLGIIE